MNSAKIAKDYGIPPRTPTTTALWAHLLRKEPLPPPPNSEIVPPPLAPIDKNSTSMRVLLHDTQGHLEGFSTRVEKLCATVESAKHEVATVNTLFRSEHENLAGDMIDLVNRCQMHILKAVGEPAQAVQLEQLSKDVDRRLEALDKRVDAIQAFSQVHSQALQTQAQALHALQNQQATMIAALMPILPLLQAIPLHIESARNNITEAFTKSAMVFSNVGACTRTVTPTHQARPETERGKETPQQAPSSSPGKRSSSTLRSDGAPSSPLPYKRPRINSPDGGKAFGQPLRTPDTLGTREQGLCSRRQTPIQARRQGSARQALLASISRPPTGSLRRQLTDTSSRRPLADILITPSTSAEAHILTRKLAPPRITGTTPSAERPLRDHSALPESAHKARADGPITQTNARNNTGPSLQAMRAPAPASASRLIPTVLSSPNVRPVLQQIKYDAPRHQVQTNPNQSDTPQLAPTVPSSPASHWQAFPPPQTRLIGPGIPPPPRPQTDTAIAQHQDGNEIIKASRTWVKPTPVIKVRERRSPFREGRRFIPLADSEDDEDEDEDEGFF